MELRNLNYLSALQRRFNSYPTFDWLDVSTLPSRSWILMETDCLPVIPMDLYLFNQLSYGYVKRNFLCPCNLHWHKVCIYVHCIRYTIYRMADDVCNVVYNVVYDVKYEISNFNLLSHLHAFSFSGTPQQWQDNNVWSICSHKAYPYRWVPLYPL